MVRHAEENFRRNRIPSHITLRGQSRWTTAGQPYLFLQKSSILPLTSDLFFSALSSQLSALSSQLSALSSQLSALSSQLSALRSQVSALLPPNTPMATSGRTTAGQPYHLKVGGPRRVSPTSEMRTLRSTFHKGWIQEGEYLPCRSECLEESFLDP